MSDYTKKARGRTLLMAVTAAVFVLPGLTG